MVGGADDRSVPGQAVLVERVEDFANALIENASAGVIGRHVFTSLRRIGYRHGRQDVAWVVGGGRLGIIAMRFVEADI